jgi:hypothetical protein
MKKIKLAKQKQSHVAVVPSVTVGKRKLPLFLIALLSVAESAIFIHWLKVSAENAKAIKSQSRPQGHVLPPHPHSQSSFAQHHHNHHAAIQENSCQTAPE